MKRGLFVLALALAFALNAGTAAAQVVGTGTVEVTVLDSSGSALPGVLVSAEANNTTTKRSAVTDTAGKAIIRALEPSERYIVTSAITGFNTDRYGTCWSAPVKSPR